MDKFQIHRRAQDCIAQGYLTNSKRPESLVKGVYPTHVKRGEGAYLIDHGGKRYLDFICGLGTNILGYGNETVDRAIGAELRNGFSHSLATHHEIETAEKIKELIPFIDCVKFLKTGSEACSAAVKIARAKTGRDLVFSEGYHGWSDQFVSLTPPAVGVPKWPAFGYFEHSSNPIRQLSISSHIDEQVAAVIIEPVITDFSQERVDWLRALREKCTKSGTLLIFDEVITGFRFPKFCVSSYFGVTPDLIVLGKAIANGMPLAAVGGKYSVMNCDEYFISSSYAGETLSLVAAKTTMTLLQTKYDLEWLWKQGAQFIEEFNGLWPGALSIEGYPSRGVLKGEPLTKALFMQEACKAGMIFGPSWFLSFPAAAEWKDAMVAIKGIVTRIRTNQVALEGEVPRSPFAQRVREAK
jgi:glutamate-1-semialdehyde 2,1-aminomutase